MDIIDEEKEFDRIKSKAVDLLLKAECDFYDAVEKLRKTHSGLTTIEQITKLTKDILKLCK